MKHPVLWIVLGLAAMAAYVIGAKAGRQRYHEIRDTAKAFWDDPQVKKARVRARKTAQKTAKRARKRIAKGR